jgi:glutathione S-transferase
MATLQIYGMPPSPFTRAVRLACREKGVDYELVPARPGETAPINPLDKIPLMKHGDFTLYESPAMSTAPSTARRYGPPKPRRRRCATSG